MPTETALRIINAFLKTRATENTYNTQLAYEAALLFAADNPEIRTQVAAVIAHLGISCDSVLEWRNQQFHDLAYAWFAFEDKRDEHTNAYLQCTRNWMNEGPRRANGALIHNCTHHPVGSLIDMHQAYLLRLARAANLSGDASFIQELCNQARIIYDELVDEDSRCYHQGKGWLENDGLSPATWSRGQGWVLHGYVQTLPLLNQWPEAQQLIESYTIELLEALKPLQGPSGLWHQLIDQPDDSFPDSSGSALIIEAYARMLPQYPQYRSVLQTAWPALQQCVDENGVVDLACKGPGTIWETAPWRMSHAPKGDPHGVFSTIFACAAVRDNYLA